MKKLAVTGVILLLVACGGSKMELNNGTGLDLDTVTVTIGEFSETFHGVAADETFGVDLPVVDASLPVLIEWEAGGETWSMEYVLIDRAAEAKRISILFAPDEVNINYTF